MISNIEKLHQAVEKLCGCSASHVRSEAVIDSFRGELVWHGMVEVFALSDGDNRRAYAWCYYPEGDETRYITVLTKPPITNALSAVRAAIASGEIK